MLTWCCKFPLIQLPRKSEDPLALGWGVGGLEFPLIQLPRKSEGILFGFQKLVAMVVSINSTSEEVRSNCDKCGKEVHKKVSINSTSEEVRSFF